MGTPEGFDESFHFLGLTLNPDMGLELPECIIQIHGGEIHLIHHTAEEQRRVCELSISLQKTPDPP